MIINDIQFNCELEDILAELISQLRANGSQLIAKQKDGPEHIQICCPYHNNGMEHRPSAGIRKSDGVFHCFACGEVHSLQEVISYCFGHTDDIVGTFGWKWLLKNFATVQVEERKDVELDFRRDNWNIDCSLDNKNYVTEEELKKYRYIHPYMYKRKLTDDIIELFDIGYDKDTQCITFPIKDIKGNVLFIARRSVNSKFFHYPCGVLKPLYGLYEYYKDIHDKTYIGKWDGQEITSGKYMLQSLPIIVCESMIDALTCWVYGKYAVALNGLGTQEQFKQLSQLPCRKLILATDNDEAGQMARTRIRYNVRNKLITEYVIPDGKKDMNDLSENEFRNILEIF